MQGFLFGKLPAFGDFVARGLSPPMRNWWDGRCSSALDHARRRMGDRFDAQCRAMPPRGFALAPPIAGGPWQAGCVIASHDRAGRDFPFILGMSDQREIDTGEAVVIGNRIAAHIAALLERKLALDALVAAVEAVARDSALTPPSVTFVRVEDAGWIDAELPEGEK